MNSTLNSFLNKSTPAQFFVHCNLQFLTIVGSVAPRSFIQILWTRSYRFAAIRFFKNFAWDFIKLCYTRIFALSIFVQIEFYRIFKTKLKHFNFQLFNLIWCSYHLYKLISKLMKYFSNYLLLQSKYGGRTTVTALSGDGVGPELLSYVQEIFRYSHFLILGKKGIRVSSNMLMMNSCL